MGKVLIGGIALATILSTSAASYRVGSGAWPDINKWLAQPASHAAVLKKAVAKPIPERRVLYWKHPDGVSDFSAEPKKTPDGQDFLPVYDDEEADFAEAKPKAAPAAAGPGKILYYRNPMGLPDTSPVPKKDWMGMDYIPVYEGEEEQGATVKVSLDKIQRSGVRTAPAEMRRLERPVRAPGIAKPDERTLYTVTLRADGFIEKLYANETGHHVKKGDPLFRVYSPDIVKVQVDYRIAMTGESRDQDGALQRLKNFQFPDAAVEQLKSTGQPVLSFDWPSPMTGVVMQKNVMEGQMVKAGEEIFRLTDLSHIWIVADVPEQDISQLRIGAPAKVTFRALPDETFQGRVTFMLHELDMTTRTAKVRVEISNPEHRIKHEMFADVEINAGSDEPERLVVPTSALIDSGNRKVVIVGRGEGRFEPRPVKTGVRGDGYVEITDGLEADELVVVTANFLIDAESNLKAALSSFTADAQNASETGVKP